MLGRIVSACLDLVAPPACIGCGYRLTSGVAPLCSACASRLAWWRTVDGCPHCGSDRLVSENEGSPDLEARNEICPGCYSQGSALHACYTLLRYEGPATEWIPSFKNRSTPFGPPLTSRLAVEFLAGELARKLAHRGLRRPDLLIPVPLHRRRRRRRGFNQSDLIARQIGAILDVPWETGGLLRVRDTAVQARLAGEARRDNLRHAFRTSEGLARLERVWLVDDVLTTGATLEAAAEALLAAGVEEVHALTLAATRPRRRPRPEPRRPARAPGEGAAYHPALSSRPPGRPTLDPGQAHSPVGEHS